jgi:hypothetical protein
MGLSQIADVREFALRGLVLPRFGRRGHPPPPITERGEEVGRQAGLVHAEDTLKEWTRERMPLQWAGTQHILGTALQTLGAREPGTARLEEAVSLPPRSLLVPGRQTGLLSRATRASFLPRVPVTSNW